VILFIEKKSNPQKVEKEAEGQQRGDQSKTNYNDSDSGFVLLVTVKAQLWTFASNFNASCGKMQVSSCVLSSFGA